MRGLTASWASACSVSFARISHERSIFSYTTGMDLGAVNARREVDLLSRLFKVIKKRGRFILVDAGFERLE